MMKALLWTLSVAATAAAAFPAAAVAAPSSTTFQVRGVEIAATSTRGTFVGTARGNAGEGGAWKAVVDHSPLSSLPAEITGGSFAMSTVGPSLTSDSVVGAFTGGTITVLNPGPGCTNQSFAVSGNLSGVATRTTSGGTGVFSVVLAHYRVFVFGRCVTYSASVSGTVSFSY